MEFDKNINYFESVRDELVKSNKDKFVLISGQKVGSFHDTRVDGVKEGREKFGVGLFIVMKCVAIEDEEIHVLHSRAGV